MQYISFRAGEGKVKGYLHEKHDRLAAHLIRPALIVCPGGGYRFVCPREADPPALQFFAMGYHVFVLEYSVLDRAGEYRPLRELAETVCMIRAHAEEWNIDPHKIAVMGFSAGGHLAASLGALWDDEELLLPPNCRPDALVLSYPVITLCQHTHAETAQNVTGGREEVKAKLSLEKHISPGMPPVFVWHTVDDRSVPVENTMMLVSALKEKHVPFECHLFAHGEHGLSTCTQEVESPNKECHLWIDLCKNWLNKQFEFLP